MAKIPEIVPDQGWAWLILTGSFVCNIFVGGVLYSFGVFFLELLDHYKESRATTAWVGSLIAGMYAAVGPISSVMCNKYGCRLTTMLGGLMTGVAFFLCTFSPNIWIMMLTYGFIAGVGFGFSYFCGFVMISNYFDKYRSVAVGIASSGSGVGTFIFAPLTAALIDIYAWKGAMWVISGLVLNACVMGAFYRPLPKPTCAVEESDNACKKKKKLLDFSVMKEPACAIICFTIFFSMLGYYIPFVFLPDLTESIGLGAEKGAFLLSIVGISNTFSRVVTGFLSNLPWVDPLKLYVGGYILGGLATLCVPWMKSYWLLCLFAVCFGLSFGGSVSLGTILLQEFQGIETISNTFGFKCMFRGLATFIGAPLAGMLYDATGNHMWTFGMAGVAIMIAGILSMPMRVLHNRKVRLNQQTDEDGEANARCVLMNGGPEIIVKKDDDNAQV